MSGMTVNVIDPTSATLYSANRTLVAQTITSSPMCSDSRCRSCQTSRRHVRQPECSFSMATGTREVRTRRHVSLAINRSLSSSSHEASRYCPRHHLNPR